MTVQSAQVMTSTMFPRYKIQAGLVYDYRLFQGNLNPRTGYFKHLANLELEFKLDSHVVEYLKRLIICGKPEEEVAEAEVKDEIKVKTDCIEDGVDAIADLSEVSVKKRNIDNHDIKLAYFWKKFDPVEEDHKKAVEILKTMEAPVRHKTQDESENAVEMFCL